MAKVKGPLMSLSASGTVADTVTFDKRGFVRQRVIPANPQTAAQGNQRQVLLSVQKALKVMGNTPIAQVKTLAEPSYRWNSYLMAQVIGASSTEFDASTTAFNALTAPQRDVWDTEAESVGITEQSITYATDPAHTAGLALFAVSRALFKLGINTGAGEPGAANAAAWAAYFSS